MSSVWPYDGLNCKFARDICVGSSTVTQPWPSFLVPSTFMCDRWKMMYLEVCCLGTLASDVACMIANIPG